MQNKFKFKFKNLKSFCGRKDAFNRKTWARIPAQSKASFFPQKDLKFLNLNYIVFNNENQLKTYKIQLQFILVLSRSKIVE